MAGVDFNRIATNIAGLNALNSLNSVNNKLAVHQMRLATGKRINEAADDPAGLTIATKFLARAEGLGQALANIGDAKNLMSVAEGGLTKINDILVKMKTKATQAASDTLGSSERAAIQQQLTDWAKEVDDIVNTTKWNNVKLLDGLVGFNGNTINIQAGADTDSGNVIQVTATELGAVSTTSLGIGAASSSVSTSGLASISSSATAATGTGFSELATGTYRLVFTGTSSTAMHIQLFDSNNQAIAISSSTTGSGAPTTMMTVNLSSNTAVNFGVGFSVNLLAFGDNVGSTSATVTYTKAGTWNGQVDTAANAQAAVNSLQSAIDQVSARLQSVGTIVSRLTFREENLTIAKTNVESAHNRIMNADMAFEQLEATKWQILQQTAVAMLGQANQAPQNILALFR